MGWLAHRTSLAMLLIGCALGSGASGCERHGDAHAKVRLVLTITAGMEERAIYEAAVRRFEREHPDIEVQIIQIPGSYYQKVLVMTAGGNAPDLMWMGQAFAEFAERDVLLDVSDRVRAEIDTKQFAPDVLGWYRVKGRQYGVPFGIDTQFIVYNRRLFDDAGVPYPRDNWDLGRFMQAAERLTVDRDGDGRIDQYAFYGELDCSLFGACFIRPDGRTVTCNSPEMLRYLGTNLDLYEKRRWAIPGKESGRRTLEDGISLFRQGRLAMMLMCTWDLPFLRQRLADMDWDITCNPRVDGRQTHWASSQAIVVSSYTKHPREAWLLAKAFLSDEFERSVATFVVPANLRIAREVLAEAALRGKPANTGALLKAACSGVCDPRVPHLAELIQYWYDAREGVWCGQATPQEAMAKAEWQINRAIREFQGNAP